MNTLTTNRGIIYEIVQYDSVLSSADKTTVMNYYINKYNINSNA
jgi:hypothetical protein